MKRHKHKVEAVLFDLGGTLVKTAEIPKVLKRILRHHGVKRSLKEIETARKQAEKGLNFRNLTTLLDEFWVNWNLRILEKLEVTANKRSLAEFTAAHWWDYCDVTLFSDAAKVLPLLKKKCLKTGIITNGLRSDAHEILSKVNLKEFFDVVVVIDTLRKMKPDTEVFHFALKKLHATASNSIFVGDELEADYKGAKKAGLTPFLIDRDDKFKGENLNRISNLEELFKLKVIPV